MVRLPQRGLLANHLASTDNLTRSTKRQNISNENKHYIKWGPNKPQYNKISPVGD